MRERLLRDEGGFTLTEVLVTMMMMITVLFALYSIFDMSIRVFSFGNDKVEAVENARLGLEKMEREIRMAHPVDRTNNLNHLFFSANGSTSNPPQAMPTSTQVTFGNELSSSGSPANGKIDCNPSGALPGDAGYTKCEYITYRLSAEPDANGPHTLLRANTADGSVTTGGDPVVEFVDGANGLEFTYCKSALDCPPSSSLTEEDINIVRVTLRIKVDDGMQTLTTDIALRNRVE